MLPDERRRHIAQRLRQHGSVSISSLEEEFSISPMTARRDLDELERRGMAARTHGGAVLPALSSHEDSFLQRLDVAVEAKERLAEESLRLIEPGGAGALRRQLDHGVRHGAAHRAGEPPVHAAHELGADHAVLVCELDAPQVEVIGAGGTLRQLTRSFVGPQAIRTIEAHFADHVFCSVRGLTDEGFLTDPDPLESEVKRAMIRRARQAVVLVDGSKFDRPALTQIAHVDEIGMILAADVDESSLRPLVRAGIESGVFEARSLPKRTQSLVDRPPKHST